MEQHSADLRVEHEAEKAAIMKLANSDVVAVRQQMERLRQQLLEASAGSASDARNMAEIDRLQQRNDELRKEILKLRMALSDQQDVNNKHLEDTTSAARREGTRLRDEIRTVRDTIKTEHKRDLERLTTQHSQETQSLISDHQRDLAASKALLAEKNQTHEHLMSSLRHEMEQMQHRHKEQLSTQSQQNIQERQDLSAEVASLKMQNSTLNDNFEAFKKAHKGIVAAQGIERSMSAKSEVSVGGESSVAQAKHHLSVVLEDELKKLQSDVIEPSADVQSRLKRFRDRSTTRSQSSEPFLPSSQYARNPPNYYQRSLSPSPSPYAPTATSYERSPSSQGDEIKRLKYLKEQMKIRLSHEQTQS